ncbi:MAG: sugar ABC transporter ATP-binding protein [Chitinispirillia bacterium]|jgi:ABC-type sugar transport system ATPase subunit
MIDNTKNLIIKVREISKRYNGLLALENVKMDIQYKEVHAVVGENGAGKSTLIKILGGIIKRDNGKVFYKGKEVNFNTPVEAINSGIGIIHQELSMLPHLNVIENVFMGRMDYRFGCILWKKMEGKTINVLKQVGLNIDPYNLVNNLSISQCQLVEIAKAISMNASLIIMDEPNSSLTKKETEQLFKLIEKLKKRGISIIYVSHKIEEVLQISDRITVLRDGKYVGTMNKKDATEDKIIQMMVGRELRREASHKGHKLGDIILEVENLTGKGFEDVSFSVRKGEIVGFSGLMGAGRSEVTRAIFGAHSFTSGKVIFQGKSVRFNSPFQAIKSGLAMLQEDRKRLSIFPRLTIKLNMKLAELFNLSSYGLINHKKINKILNKYTDLLSIKFSSLDNPIISLSGGNQQKVVLARWLITKPKILILDEPTHGVDVITKTEIYKLMHKLSLEGMSIILISSELPEILLMSDKVVVMREGKVKGILKDDEMKEDTIMAYSTLG